MNSTAVLPQQILFTYTPVIYQEYLLVINPDAGVASDLSYTQKKAADAIGQSLKNNDTFITITSFFADPSAEKKIEKELRGCIRGKVRPSFIWLENYGCNPSTGSIYIRSKPAIYFRTIQQAIYPGLTLSSAVDKSSKINFVKEPHIIIAKTNRKKAQEWWPLFKDKKYENKFIADSLFLLKRNTTEDHYDLVAEIRI